MISLLKTNGLCEQFQEFCDVLLGKGFFMNGFTWVNVQYNTHLPNEGFGGGGVNGIFPLDSRMPQVGSAHRMSLTFTHFNSLTIKGPFFRIEK